MEREYIGIDLHKQFFQACALTATGVRLWEGRFPRSAVGLTRLQARIGAGTGLAVEASGPTWAFVDALAGSGATICVVDPRKTRLRAGDAAKTDRLDARRLADALRRDSVVSIYVPPPAIRELREVCRGRHQVVRLRTRIAQMIRALLLRTDGGEPPGSRLYAPAALAWLAQVRLAPDAEGSLRRLERLYRAVHAEAQAADDLVRARAAADPIAIALEGLVGIGPVLAVTLRAARRRQQRRPVPQRPHHAGRVAVAALGARRSGDARDSASGRDRPLGAPPRGAERRLQSPGRLGAAPVRRHRHRVATIELSE